MGGDPEILPGFRAAEYEETSSNCPAVAEVETDYFTKILEDDLKSVVKPQYVDQIPKAVKGPNKTVQALLEARSQMDNLDEILDVLGTACAIT